MNDTEEYEEDTQLENLEDAVSKNPFKYDAHIALLKGLRNAGELERLRGARRQMSEVFPLTAELWLEWIADERDYGDADGVRQLFQRAVKDYVSVEVWLEFVQWACGAFTDPDEVRQIFEEALMSVGLHVGKGCLLWDAYREFELVWLNASKTQMDQDPGSETKQELSKAEDRVRNLFRREFCVPLVGLETAWAEFGEFLQERDEEVPAATTAIYQKSLAKLKTLMPFEQQLMVSPGLETYRAYLDEETGKNEDPSRVQTLFERAIADHCLNDRLWLRYLKWLDEELRVPARCLPVYARAVRNCSWVAGIWLRYILALERSSASFQDIDDIFQQALNGGYQTVEEGIQLWLNFAHVVRRVKCDAGEGQTDYGPVIAAYEQGARQLRDQFGRQWDPEWSYRRSWARFLASKCRRADEAHSIWKEIMSEGNGSRAAMWLDFFRMEREFGPEPFRLDRCRKILSQALNSVTDAPELVSHTLLEFEREEGNLAQLDAATAKVESRLKSLAERKKKQKEKNESEQARPSKRPHKEEPVMKAGKLKDEEGFAIPAAPPPPAKKAKTGSDPEPVVPLPPNAKEEHMAAYDRTVFISNIGYFVTEEKIRQIFSELGTITDIRLVGLRNKRHKGYGYVEFESADAATQALSLDRTPVDGRPMFVSRCQDKEANPTQFRFRTGLEKHKLFVKNIHPAVSEAKLLQLFSAHGKVVSARIATFKNGKSKGFAYVEFEKEEEAGRALMACDGAEVAGKAIEVALSHPPARKTPSQDTSKPHGRLQLHPPGPVPTSDHQPQNTKLSNQQFRDYLLKK